jgi:ADP-heptose:LPS heptosyltransferase
LGETKGETEMSYWHCTDKSGRQFLMTDRWHSPQWWVSKVPATPLKEDVSTIGRILFCNELNALGDFVMALPAIKRVIQKGATVGYAVPHDCDRSRFHGMKGIYPVIFPAPLETLSAYKRVLIPKGMGRVPDNHGIPLAGDSLHPTDEAFYHFGEDPNTIPDDEKRVAPFVSEKKVNAFRKQFGRFGVYVLAASERYRSVRTLETRAILEQLTKLDLKWLAIGTEEQINEALPFLGGLRVQPAKTQNNLDLFALIKASSVVVSPDTAAVHIAGALRVPCVGLWGPVHPQSRTNYYPEHRSLWRPAACEYSPCFSKVILETGNPLSEHCRTAQEGGCLVLDAITPDDVAEKVRECLR